MQFAIHNNFSFCILHVRWMVPFGTCGASRGRPLQFLLPVARCLLPHFAPCILHVRWMVPSGTCGRPMTAPTFPDPCSLIPVPCSLILHFAFCIFDGWCRAERAGRPEAAPYGWENAGRRRKASPGPYGRNETPADHGPAGAVVSGQLSIFNCQFSID